MFPVFLVYRALLNLLLWDCHVGYLSIVNMSFPYKYYHCSLLCSCDLMVNSAFFDPSNAQSQFALKFKFQCNSVRSTFKCYLQLHAIFSTVNALFSEFKQIPYKCKILSEPKGTNSYQSYVLRNSWLVRWLSYSYPSLCC